MNGVTIERMSSLEDAVAADAVIVGSGIATREVVDPSDHGCSSWPGPSAPVIQRNAPGRSSWLTSARCVMCPLAPT